MFTRTISIFSIVFLMLSLSAGANAANITRYWSSANDNNTAQINHSVWNDFLQKYINTDNDNKVRYKEVSTKDKQALNNYIQEMANIDPLSYKRTEQYAYWANLYNAITIKIILDHYPVKSIKDIKLGGGLFTSGPWKADVVTINQKKLSLDNIEHDILRPIWKDPRTHYAVNCASIGCPNLANQAFTSANTESLLEENAKRFINSDKGVKIVGNKATLSKIYSWFKEDFGTKQKNILKHIKQYANTDLSQKLDNPSLRVNFRYNWDLNDNN